MADSAEASGTGRYSNLRLSRRSPLDSTVHTSKERHQFAGKIVGESELACLREDLHSGRRSRDIVAPERAD